MKPEIKNGILIAGNERIILAHVQKWKLDGNVIVFFMAGTQISLNLPMEAAKADADLLEHFQKEQEKRDNPLRMVAHDGPIDLSSGQITEREPFDPFKKPSIARSGMGILKDTV